MRALSLRLHHRPVFWLGFYGLCLVAWLLLFLMQVPDDLRALAAVYGSDFWAALCAMDPSLMRPADVFGMWLLMSAAMMAPTFVPTLAVYDDLIQSGAVRGFTGLLSGYLAIWFGFAAVATVLQLGLNGADLLDPFGASANVWMTVALLAMAGGYQFSQLKEACLSKCRRPMAFFMSYWQEGAWRMGVRLGLICLGCCWALMLLTFVGGTMNLLWMGAGMVLMTLEKLPDIGQRLTRPLGYGLLIAAGTLAMSAILNGGTDL